MYKLWRQGRNYHGTFLHAQDAIDAANKYHARWSSIWYVKEGSRTVYKVGRRMRPNARPPAGLYS